MRPYFISLLLVLIPFSGAVLAEEPAPQAQLIGPQAKALHDSLTARFPTMKPNSVIETPVPGLYEVMMGPTLFYLSADGKYLVKGEIIDLDTEQNLTEARQNEARRKLMSVVRDEETLIFGPADAKHTVTVFTDIDCSYCRKLHSEMKDYNDLGISIRYLFYPRAGVGSESYDKAVSVWCSDDRKAAMTQAKRGESLEKKSCENPVMNHLLLGRLLKVSGTPTMVMENGMLAPGYIPAKNLYEYLQEPAKEGVK